MNIEKMNMVNEYLKNQLWMDFEVCCVSCAKIEMFGFLDEAGENKIKIIFCNPYMMLSTFYFTYEGNSDLISLVTGNEAIELNKKYNVTQGNQIFKLSNTNIESDLYIIAEEMDVQILE